MANYIERHFDYVWGPDQDSRLASVAPNEVIELQIPISANAPFVLRSRAMRVSYGTGTKAQNNLNHLLLKWANADRKFQSQHFIRQNLLGPYWGQIGNPLPVYPEVFYPQQSHILVNVLNDGASALVNVTLYFRGVELYSVGAVKSYTYPPKFGCLPYVYPQVVKSLAVTTSGAVRNIFTVKTDADFVLRGLQAGLPFSSTPVQEVFIQLKDEDEKPYSSAPVHADMLAGNSGLGAIFPANGTYIKPVGGGPAVPGLLFPELYLPKNHIFYFDVTRSDAAYAEATTVDYPIQFIGMKVFEK